MEERKTTGRRQGVGEDRKTLKIMIIPEIKREASLIKGLKENIYKS